MQALTNWGFRNKAAMTLFIIITLLIGIISYFRLPMEFLPEADNPQVTVVTLGQGYDAGSMTYEHYRARGTGRHIHFRKDIHPVHDRGGIFPGYHQL